LGELFFLNGQKLTLKKNTNHHAKLLTYLTEADMRTDTACTQCVLNEIRPVSGHLNESLFVAFPSRIFHNGSRLCERELPRKQTSFSCWLRKQTRDRKGKWEL